MGLFSSPAPAAAASPAALALPVTMLTAAALGLLLVKLSLVIIGVRRKSQTSIGDGGVKGLASKIRAHGNLAEFAPLFLIELGLVEASALVPRPALALVAATFVASRLSHANAMAFDGPMHRRVLGMHGTFYSIAALSVCCVAAAVKALKS